ncbi:coiled-coil domain-containing protein 151 [Copidosoma floridanum]|uniref:coiled-coil domain-containing protein 151 n=1 Tax=Copidosoma floridanum TaxID=29053 RepID=UPI000C6F67CB|nr:coiled-coil domain-containing protein 151 [Copidosoma floridanum]
MQMEADTVRKKYRSVRSSLKMDASFYVSCLDELEGSIREQENEIKRLQKVKVEAMELRDATREALTKQEIEAIQTSKERESAIQEFRKRVEERKLELERIERHMFSTTRTNAPRDDDDYAPDSPESARDVPRSEIDRLEEVFVKLRNATGVSKTEEVLDRFLAQKATREKLKKMQAVTEEEKMRLEKQRQQLTAEIEMQKFSETKDADQTAEKSDRLKREIEEQRRREEDALAKREELQESLRNIGRFLYAFYQRLRSEKTDVFEENGVAVVEDETTGVPDSMELLDELNNNVNEFIENIGGSDKYNDLLDQMLSDKMEALSLGASSEQTKESVSVDDRPLFFLFPTVTTPAAQTQPSEDEEDIPSRSTIKRQAQLLVDTKSRRKGFAFKR